MQGRDTHQTVRDGEWVELHRCRKCGFRARGGGVGITALDNGFVDARQPYPHTRDCQHSGDF